jgi:hypothetical protein
MEKEKVTSKCGEEPMRTPQQTMNKCGEECPMNPQ